MIYTADDYIEKYQNTLSRLLCRAIGLKRSFSYVENKIAYSNVFSEFEKSNITLIAFSDSEQIYNSIFSYDDEDLFMEDDTVFSWLGFIYIHLFLKFKTTFEMLFFALPIQKALQMFHLYHEMDLSQIEEYFINATKPTHLSCIMKAKKISTKQLSEKTGISFATIRSLKTGYRAIDKLEASKLISLAFALNVKSETLLSSIPLDIE